MNENLHDIDKIFHDGINGHKDMPSGKVWESIDQQLDKRNVTHAIRKYKNLKRLSVAILLLLIGSIAYQVHTKMYIDKEAIKNNKQPSESTTASKLPDNQSIIKSFQQKSLDKNSAKELSTGKNEMPLPEKNMLQKPGEAIVKTPLNRLNTATNSSIPKNEVALNQTKNSFNKIADGTSKGFNHAGIIEKDKRGSIVAIRKSSMKINHREKVITTPAEFSGPMNPAMIAGIPYSQPSIQVVGPTQKPTFFPILKNEKNVAGKPMLKSKQTAFHYSLKAFYTPQISFNRIEDDHHRDRPAPPHSGRDDFRREENKPTTASMGIVMELPVGKRWGLLSGISYTNTRINIEPKKIFAQMDTDGKVKYRFDCSSGYTYLSPKTVATPSIGDSISVTQSYNRLQYLGIPLGVNYTFSLGKFSIIPTVGAVANFSVKQQIATSLVQGSLKETQTSNNIQGLKGTYFNAFANIVFEYNIGKKLALSLAPAGSFALSSITKNTTVKSYPNSFGLTSGIKIKL